MRWSSWSAPCVLLLAACQATVGLPPDEVTGMPWGDAPGDRLAWSARQAVERGEPARALVQLRTVLIAEPGHVDANRLRQDLLRQRGRRGRLLVEARRAVERRPDDGIAHYLMARITEDPAAKLAGFERAAELSPGLVWPWLGLAHTLRGPDLDRALAIYERLFHATGQHPLVGVAWAAALREADRDDEAVLVYRALRTDRRVPGVGDLGLAQVALGQDERDEAWAALMQAMRQRPFDPGVQGLVHGWLETSATGDQAQQVLDVLREDGDRLRAFATDAGAGVLAGLMVREGQPWAARALLEQQVAERPAPAARRELRRLLLSLGDVDAFVARLAADVPRHVVDVEGNELRGRWLTLLDGGFGDGRALGDGDVAVAFATALRDCGLLVEAERFVEVAVVALPGHADALRALGDEARRELAFEAGLRRLLYRGYQRRDTADLAEVLDRVRELSMRVLGDDVVGAPEHFFAPLVGEMLDPFTGGLAEHLARYNRHLVLGRRSGGTAEGLMVTRLSLAELPDVPALPLAGRCYEVVGMDRDVKALGGVLGGDLAGVALLNHFLIDHDAVLDWAIGLRDRRRVAREDELALTRDPVPTDVGLDPIDAAWRLTLASPVPDDELDAAVLDMIRTHERRHLVDSFHYLPIEANLWRGLGLMIAFGASPAAIEAEMERRAELAALAVSPHTELVLAHIVDFYGDPPRPSPHHRGFSQLLEELHDELLALGVAPADAVPSRWHLVDRERLREAAARLLGDLPSTP